MAISESNVYDKQIKDTNNYLAKFFVKEVSELFWIELLTFAAHISAEISLFSDQILLRGADGAI